MSHRHPDRAIPRDELAATIARAEALLPAMIDRLAPLVAGTTNELVIRLFVHAELHRLLCDLATGVSEPARRGLLGLEPPTPALRRPRNGRRP